MLLARGTPAPCWGRAFQPERSAGPASVAAWTTPSMGSPLRVLIQGLRHDPPPGWGCGRGLIGCGTQAQAAPHKLFSPVPGGRILVQERLWLPLHLAP